MRVLLTGATGYVGVKAAKETLKMGWKLRVLVRKNSKNISSLPEDRNLEIVLGDLSFKEEAKTKSLLKGVDVVVHNGYFHDINEIEDPLLFFKYNVWGTFRLMEFSRKYGVKQFVFISSGAAYGGPLIYKPADELHVCRPAGGYGAYKAAVDAYVYAMGSPEWNFNICSLRLGHVYGIFRDRSRMAFYETVKSIVKNEKIVKVAGSFNFIHAGDAGKAMVFVIGRKDVQRQVFNVENDNTTLAKNMAGYVKKITGSSSRLVFEKTKIEKIANEKFKKLGFKFSNEKGVREYLKSCIKEIQGL